MRGERRVNYDGVLKHHWFWRMTLVVLVRRLEADCTIIYNPAAYGYANALIVHSLIFRRTPLSYEHVPQQHHPANDEDISGR
jgi:hypothetical protein